MIKCRGCGVLLQNINENKPGYIKKEKINENDYCTKCFKLIHYGSPVKSAHDISTPQIIDDINMCDGATLTVIDIFNITDEAIKHLKDLKGKKYVLLSKYDLLPRSVKEAKIVNYFKKNFYDECEVICISSKKNYNIDRIFEILNKKNIDKVYVIGLINSGKSSLINALLSSKKMKPYITTSLIPNTTVSYLNINIDGITFVDTPGFSFPNSIYSYLPHEELLKIEPKKELKVKTFQIRSGYSVIVGNVLRIDCISGNNSFNFYMSNNLNYKKVKTRSNNLLITMPSKTFDVDGEKDIVVQGLGFIKINKAGVIKIFSLSEELIDIRNKMI